MTDHRKRYDNTFKAKVVLESFKNEKTIAELAGLLPAGIKVFAIRQQEVNKIPSSDIIIEENNSIGMVGTRQSRTRRGLALRVTKGPREVTGVTLPLDGPLLIGRSPDADLVIADDFVSSTHARIMPVEGGLVLEDLGSTNGTLVNGQPARRPLPVAAGDVIELGQNRLEVVRL